MPTVEYNIVASISKYKDKSGKDKVKYRQVGEVCIHSDGRRYIAIDPFFNLAACERPQGRDKVFLSLIPPDNNNN